MTLNRLFASLIVLAGSVFAAPQDPPKPAAQDAPRRDPEAVKMLEKHDAQMYVAREEGLKDLTFTMRLPLGVDLDVKWLAPDKTGWTAAPAADVPADVAKKIRLTLGDPKFRADLDAQVPSFAHTMISEKESATYAGDGLEVVSQTQLRIVAKSPTSVARMKEALVTFDEKGRVKAISITSPVGGVSEMEPTYVERKDKFVVKTLKITTKTAAAPQVAQMEFEYGDIGGFSLLTRLVLKNGPQGDQDLRFTNHKPNSGLTEADLKPQQQ